MLETKQTLHKKLWDNCKNSSKTLEWGQNWKFWQWENAVFQLLNLNIDQKIYSDSGCIIENMHSFFISYISDGAAWGKYFTDNIYLRNNNFLFRILMDFFALCLTLNNPFLPFSPLLKSEHWTNLTLIKPNCINGTSIVVLIIIKVYSIRNEDYVWGQL